MKYKSKVIISNRVQGSINDTMKWNINQKTYQIELKASSNDAMKWNINL